MTKNCFDKKSKGAHQLFIFLYVFYQWIFNDN